MSSFRAFLVVLAAWVVGATVLLRVLLGSTPAAPAPASSTPGDASTATPLAYAPGTRAVQPRLMPTDPTAPAITPEDISAYILARGVGGKVGQAGPHTVESVECLSGAAVRQRIGTSEGRPDDHPLCLATVRGQFAASGPPPVSGRRASGRRGTTVRMLFDGRTGNLLYVTCCS